MTRVSPGRVLGALRAWPVVTLRRQLMLAFVGLVGVAVVLVGGITYRGTVETYDEEMDRALVSAASTIAAGGTVPTTPVVVDQQHGHEGSNVVADPVISVVQDISPDGTVTLRAGATVLPVDRPARGLAANGDAGEGRFDEVSVNGTDYRVYTLAKGGGQGAVQVARDLADASRVLTQIAVITALVGVSVILLAAVAGWWLARHITRRLAALSTSAQRVAETGDLTVPIEATGRDEVGRLGDSLRTMLVQLGQSREAQQRLVQNAGHELRTPITSLRTNARVMRRVEQLTPEDRTNLLDDMDGELKDLTDLVNELVALAMDSRSTEPVVPTDLAVLAETVAARARRRTDRVVTVSVEPDGGTAPTRVVARRALERALTNLVENAAKFDTSDAPIEIVVGHGGVEVRDRGPGVPENELERIFDRFHRTDTARSRPGSGLGLAIVREVAEQHGGTVTARPRAGGGLIVAITVPDYPATEDRS